MGTRSSKSTQVESSRIAEWLLFRFVFVSEHHGVSIYGAQDLTQAGARHQVTECCSPGEGDSLCSRGHKDRARAHAIWAQKPSQSQRWEEIERVWCESYNQSHKEEERGVGKSTADRDEEGKR